MSYGCLAVLRAVEHVGCGGHGAAGDAEGDAFGDEPVEAAAGFLGFVAAGGAGEEEFGGVLGGDAGCAAVEEDGFEVGCVDDVEVAADVVGEEVPGAELEC